MKAIKTFYIGLFVLLLSITQLVLTGSLIRLIGVFIGLFLIAFGWKIGWTRYKNFTLLLGHFVLVAGCLVTSYAIYQLPFMVKAPSLTETVDLPLFWGLFTIFGGYCMITHGYCNCAMKMHDSNQGK